MSATFTYTWDQDRECWQIVSRSGHVVFQSQVKQQVRLLCQQLESRQAAKANELKPAAASCGKAERRCQAAQHVETKKYAAGQGTPPSRAKLKSSRWSAFTLPSVSWPTLVTALGLAIGAALAWLPSHDQVRSLGRSGNQALAADVHSLALPAQPSTAYQVVWQTELQERSVRVPRKIVETKQVEQRVKVLRPVVETQQREETVLVRRPVIETSVRYEKFTVNEPVTTYETQSVDRGRWTQQVVAQPATAATRMRWVPGGWTTDAQSGVTSWKLPMFRLVQEPQPVAHQANRVWQPNVVPTQVPRTTYRQRIETRPVNVQNVRYVEEKQVRKVPVQVQRMVEQEEVRSMPVTTCRTVYEDKVERVPVKVCRKVPLGQQRGQEIGQQPTESSPTVPVRATQNGRELEAEEGQHDLERPKSGPAKKPSSSRLPMEMRRLDTERMAQHNLPRPVSD